LQQELLITHDLADLSRSTHHVSQHVQPETSNANTLPASNMKLSITIVMALCLCLQFLGVLSAAVSVRGTTIAQSAWKM
jgi:hypothetical protein